MASPEGVYITPAQTYQEVRELSRKFDRIESKLDGILNVTTDHETRLRSIELGETEWQKRDRARLDALERRVWTASGAATVLGAGAGYLLQFINR